MKLIFVAIDIYYIQQDYPTRQFSIQASYLEIYDEEIRDLLSVEPFHGEIIIGEDARVNIERSFQFLYQTIQHIFGFAGKNCGDRSNSGRMPVN